MNEYFNVKKPLSADKNWEARFMIWCKALKLNYVRRAKKGSVSFDISGSREDYDALVRLIERYDPNNHESEEFYDGLEEK